MGQGLEGTTIEDYVRIGGGVRILLGITIGKYALIGVESIVTKDIPSKATKKLKRNVNSVMTWE